jgi:NAD(P)-dependent dehydrogenase (short-subunit alcohol dehydrogenase family)
MIKYDLNNRVAVVTGGAQGFGLAITERFIEAGAKVIIWDIDENAAKEAIDKVKSENLSHQVVDVTNFEIVYKNLEEVEKKHGKIDIFVNNAGIAGMNTTVAEYPLDEWKKVINCNSII